MKLEVNDIERLKAKGFIYMCQANSNKIRAGIEIRILEKHKKH